MIGESTQDGLFWASWLGGGDGRGGSSFAVVVEGWVTEDDALCVLLHARGENASRVIERCSFEMPMAFDVSAHARAEAESSIRRSIEELVVRARPEGARVSALALYVSPSTGTVTAVAWGELGGVWLAPGRSEPLLPPVRDANAPRSETRRLADSPPVVLLCTPHVFSALGDAGMPPAAILEGMSKIYPARDRLRDTLAPVLSPDGAMLFVAL